MAIYVSLDSLMTIYHQRKHGFKMHFAGSPWGTDDHAVIICSSEKQLSDWSKFIQEWLRDGKVTGTRTVLVNIPD